MAIILEKGKSINLSLTHVRVELGWSPNTNSEGYDYDLDASAFLLGKTRKLQDTNFFVFYNNPSSPDKSVISSGDDLTGEDGETLDIYLDKTHSTVMEILFVVSIYKGEERCQNFGQIKGAFMSLSNADSGEEIARFNLTDDYSNETAVEFGRLIRNNEKWSFEAIGIGTVGGMQAITNKYQLSQSQINNTCKVAT